MKTRLLIDTQILIWTIIEPGKLSSRIKKLLAENTILVSQISFKEIAIKQAVDKIPGYYKTTAELVERVTADGFQILPLTNEHIDAYAAIPLYSQHKDPFDRLLLATAFSEKIKIVSADNFFTLYTSHVGIIEA